MGIKKDSIGRSEVYNNPYDLRYVSNTTIKKARAEGFQDTMESPQARLEKDLFRQLQEGYFNIPKGGVVYILYVGKGLFFIMTVPAYLLLYGIPKWLVLQAGPATVNFIQKGANFLKEQFQKIILTHLQDIFRKITERLGKLLRGLHEIANSAEIILKAAKHFSDALKDMAAENLKKLNEAFNAVMEPFRKAADVAKNASEWAQKKANTLVDGAKALINKTIELAQNPFQAISEVIKESVKRSQDAAGKTIKYISETLDRNFLSPLRDLNNKLSEYAKKISEVIAEAYKKRVLEPSLKVAEKIKNAAEATLDFLRERQERILDRAKDFGNKTVELYQKTTQNIGPITASVVAGMVNLVPQPVINFFIPVATVVGALARTPRNLYKAGKKLIEKVRNLQQWTKSASKWVIFQVKKGVQAFAKALKWTFEKAKKIPSKVWRFLCAAVSVTLEAGRRIIFLLRLLFSWLKVLIKYGFFKVRRIAEGA